MTEQLPVCDGCEFYHRKLTEVPRVGHFCNDCIAVLSRPLVQGPSLVKLAHDMDTEFDLRTASLRELVRVALKEQTQVEAALPY